MKSVSKAKLGWILGVLFCCQVISVNEVHAEPASVVQFEIGTGVPPECTQITMASVTAISCPTIQYIFNTLDLLNNGFGGALNHFAGAGFSGFSENSDLSRSEETDHISALILIKRLSIAQVEIWRVEGSETDEDVVDFSVLFSLQI